jgi:hypothetical protein
MASAVTREWKVTYGNRTVGAGTDYPITGFHGVDVEYGLTSVSFEFMVTESSESAFATTCAAMESDFRTPRARLRLFLGSATLLDLNPASGTNTGFNARSKIRKKRGPEDTARSRVYVVTIDVQTPADLTGQSGRLDSRYNVEVEPGGRKTLTITGSYTALTSNAARAQFEAAIGTYESTLYTALGGTWELVRTPQSESDDTDKTLVFTRVHRSIVLDQSGSAVNDADIVDHVITVTRGRSAPGDTQRGAAVARFQEIRVRFSCWVLASGGDLRTKWEDVIRPWLKSYAFSITGASTGAVVEDEPEIDGTTRRIEAHLRILALNGSNVIALNVTTQDETDEGLLLVPVWSGDKFAKDLIQGPANRTRTVTTTGRRVLTTTSTAGISGPLTGGVTNELANAISDSLGSEFGGFGFSSPGDVSLDFGGGGGGASAGGGVVPSPSGPVGGSRDGFVQMGSAKISSPLTIGLTGETIDLEDFVQVQRLAYRKAAK